MRLELLRSNQTPDESVLVELYGDHKKYLLEVFSDGNIALVEKTERGTRAWDFTIERLVEILSETNTKLSHAAGDRDVASGKKQ